jgi:catechol 2,3-dioxygenase-like lactoylglutathione lyase family enzyme
MAAYGVTHIALRVVELEAAEAFYCALFQLNVAWREAKTVDGWKTLPSNKFWPDAHAARVALGLVMLHRPGFVLALEAAEAVSDNGKLSHIGLRIDSTELARLRHNAAALGCQLLHEHPSTLVFDDLHGVRWEPTTMDYSDPGRYSTGAHTGQWLQV